MAETKVVTSKLIVMTAVEPKDELDEASTVFHHFCGMQYVAVFMYIASWPQKYCRSMGQLHQSWLTVVKK
jgi:hypothetical protein